MKNKKLIRLFIISVLLLLLFDSFINFGYGVKRKDLVKIVFLVDGDNPNDYENMKAGAISAGEDKNCLIDFVNISKEETTEADVYFVVANHNLRYYDGTDMVDDFSLAEDFSNSVLANSDCDSILLVSSGENKEYVNAIEGFKTSIIESGRKVEYRPLSKDVKKLKQSMYNLEQSGLFDTVIALDRPSLSAAVEANTRTNPFVKIYGVDNSSEAVYYLDNGSVEALAYKDEYSMGYTAVRHALKDYSLDKIAKEKSFYYIADKDVLYSDDMEMVLFPFVK